MSHHQSALSQGLWKGCSSSKKRTIIPTQMFLPTVSQSEGRLRTYLRKNPFSPALGTTVEKLTIKWDSNFALNCVACKFTLDFVNVVHNVASTAKNSLLHLQHWDKNTHTHNGYYLYSDSQPIFRNKLKLTVPRPPSSFCCLQSKCNLLGRSLEGRRARPHMTPILIALFFMSK